MTVPTRKKLPFSILIPFLIFIIFFSIMIWQKYRSSHEVPVASPRQQQSEGTRMVTLFFADDGPLLAREAREIDPCDDDNACLKSILDELLNGPVGEFTETVPEGTVIDVARIEGNLATIELNRTFAEAMLSGSSAETLAVYSVVNTVAANFSQIQKVKINVGGNTSAVLHHLDLSEPFAPDFSLEQPPPSAPEKKLDRSGDK